MAKARSWLNRNLYSSGRLQLLNSILFSIQVYWSCLFILPKTVIEKITPLWKGSDLSYGNAKVAWDTICFPKKEGGLGVKNIEVWNRESMVKHLWSSRISSYLLYGRSIWEIPCPKNYCWSWRNILGFHGVRKCIYFRVGDANSISLWFYNWHLLGPW